MLQADSLYLSLNELSTTKFLKHIYHMELFYPEFEQFIDTKNKGCFKKIIDKRSDFDKNRQIGENESYIEEFIS